MSAAPAHIAYYRSPHAQPSGVLNAADLSPLPLEGCVVDVQIQWFHALVTVKQEFRNPNPTSIQSFGSFHLEPEWSFVALRAEVDNHFIVSENRRLECEEVKTTAPTRVANLATVQIPWEILGSQTVITTLSFLCPLHLVDAHTVKFSLSREVIPVSITQQGGSMSGIYGKEENAYRSRFTRKSQPRLPASVLIHGTASLYGAVDQGVSCNTSGASTNRMGDPRRFEIKYENRDEVSRPEKHFELTAKMVAEPEELMVRIVREEGEHVADSERFAMGISITPSFDVRALANPNVEVTFAVDCSGSMANKIDATHRALKNAIHALPASCFMNVMCFGQSQQWLFNDAVQVTPDIVSQVDGVRFSANMGSTRLFDALAEAYIKPVVSGHARVIVLISDGSEAKQMRRMLELINANTHTTRLAAISVGSDGAHPALFSEMARIGNGVVAHAATGEDVGRHLAAVLGEVLVPTLSFNEISFSYDAQDERPPIRLCRDSIQLIPANTRYVIYGLADASLRGCTVRMNSLIGGEQRGYSIHTGQIESWDSNASQKNDASSYSIVHCAAAIQRIHSLVNLNPRSCMTAEQRNEVLNLATTFSVPSPLTNFYCMNEKRQAADPRVIHCPFIEDRLRYDQVPPCPDVRGKTGEAVDPDVWIPMQLSGHAEPNDAAALANLSASPTRGMQPQAGPTTHQFMRSVVESIANSICAPASLDDLLQYQRVDGSWCHEDFKPVSALGMNMAQVKQSMPAHLQPEGEEATGADFDAWFTALVVMRLAQDFGSHPEAVLAEAKGRRWVNNLGKGKSFLSEAASQLLSNDTLSN